MTEGKEPTGPVIPSSETEHSSDSSSVDIDIDTDSDSATDISVKMMQNENSAYDLTPFTPDEVPVPVPVLDRSQEEGGGGGGVDVDDKDHSSGTFNFDFNTYCTSENVHIIEEEEDEVEEKFQEGQESQEEINKREEEGLLQSGNDDDQLARIAMYYTRVEDSDSDDDDEYKNEDEDKDEDEDKFEWGNTCTQDEISEHQMYAGLSDQMEEVETMDTIDTITACSTSTGPASTIEEENGLVSLVESLKFEKTSIEDEATIEFPCFPSVDNVNASPVEVEECDNSTESKNSSSLSIAQGKTVVKKYSMSKAVPLIKPPSAEKMQAYLLSKGFASAGPKSLLKKIPTSPSEIVEDSDRSSQESPAFASFAAFED